MGSPKNFEDATVVYVSILANIAPLNHFQNASTLTFLTDIQYKES